ncbi:phosphate ABC transporter ATP-binding protein [Thermofilum pendens]|uniref:ABC transporter related n=1 Tax=Thermofilum pendens (strain DSM 2475 / Hrk 5) TaxID=368408 RepID=A1RZ31_THEPD|nr:phosphate ABC transporter ATP-binding protein [Thermofilum pendens]ABL78461.1 ABC transporter related [Thermofilum pendens Hrk 5]
MSDPAVRTVNLNVYYGKEQVLFDVNISVPRRGIYAVMGPSGCGKSTLLRTINRLIELRPEARVKGRVEVNGLDVYRDLSPEQVARMVGMVFQTPNPLPHLSIYDNVALGPRLHGLARGRQLDAIVREALEQAALWDEVKDKLRKPATTLSGGQQQRLCIARALALKPSVLLMDEPTANLDPVNAAKIEDLVKSLSREITVIIVTHDPEQALRLASRGALLFKGRVVREGVLSSVITSSREYYDILRRLAVETPVARA